MDKERLQRDLTELNQARAVSKEIEEEGGWGNAGGVYAADAEEYLEKVDAFFPGLTAKLREQVAKWKAEGKSVTVADIAGMASAESIGADLTMNIALGDPENRMAVDSSKRVLIVADITTTSGQRKVLEAVDDLSVKPSIYFFFPGAAIAPSGVFSETLGLRLSTFFKELYDRLPAGGHMVINLLLWEKSYTDRFEAFLQIQGIPHQSNTFLRGFHIYKRSSSEES